VDSDAHSRAERGGLGLYNDAAEARGFEGFAVHMHLAWLYLLQAAFVRDGVDFRYRDRDNPRRFIKVDGEYKCWELARCVEERWPDPAEPVRNNLDFFIRLRNRIEHRHKKSDTELALAVSGHAQPGTAAQLRGGDRRDVWHEAPGMRKSCWRAEYIHLKEQMSTARPVIKSATAFARFGRASSFRSAPLTK
jgi:hypothetical protein